MRLLTAIFLVLALSAIAKDDKPNVVQTLIPWLLDEGDALKDIPFPDVIAATSGRRVLPLDRAVER